LADDKIATSESTHQTSVVKEKDSPAGSKKRYIQKSNPSLRSISEIEAFNAACYGLLIDDRHPNVSAVHGESGERLGIVSEVIPGFVNLLDYVKANGKLTEQDITHSEMMKVWTAAYIEEEFDLHPRNYGFNELGFCVKIDDDRSTWRLTAKYMGAHPEKEMKVHEHPSYKTQPVHAFKVTSQEISSLPLLQKSDPFHWVDKQKQDRLFLNIKWSELAKLKSIQNDKFYVFLRRILIPDEVYEALGKAHIGSENTRQKFVSHKQEKTQEL
jgi:hypothetical protein